MEIALVSNGMPFGPDTLKHHTLGGSETACLMVAKKLKEKGHIVNVFTPLPQGVPSGVIGEDDGVRYIALEHYAGYADTTEVDLLIVLRDPRMLMQPNQAKKRVLWMHDLATYRGMGAMFGEMAWSFDEIWTVSEFHRAQVHEITGYPLSHITALRNGIVPVEVVKPPFRLDKTIAYAARPERGLANFIKEGGIMEHLPDYTLKLSMYANYPEHMENFYGWCNHRINQLPNVDLPEELTQQQMRQRLADVEAYVYPTQFEETSCILARECIEQQTPFLTTREGALPETLGSSGIFFEDYLEQQGFDPKSFEPGSPEWCEKFAHFIRFMLEGAGAPLVDAAKFNMTHRNDLYWDGVASEMLYRADPIPVSGFSVAWSLVQDGDVIPARAYLKSLGELNELEQHMLDEIEELYPFILDEDDPRYVTLSDYYNEVFYREKADEIDVSRESMNNSKTSPRYQHIFERIKALPRGSTVVEYGAGEGHIIVPLAEDFPEHNFIAFDQVRDNIERHALHACDNLKSFLVETPDAAHAWLKSLDIDEADAVICVEVLEHCPDPFEVIEGVEAMCKKGGQVIISTPYGAWEPSTFEHKKDQWHLRNHIWHFTKSFIRDVFRGKENFTLLALAHGKMQRDGWAIGNFFYGYEADHKAVNRVDPLNKALNERHRQTVGVAMIAYNNEDTILRTLNSLDHQVQYVQIAHGPSTDGTLGVIEKFAREHPWIKIKVIEVPKIAAPKQYGGTVSTFDAFGFDDARNASIANIDDLVDWVLWIDTDEYMAGQIGQYLRNNALDAYLIPQHHFTVEPRGGATQIDRPARLFRTGLGFKARGRIHEHFELPSGGPGFCFMLPDVDIGHTGYVNEDRRRQRFNRNWPFLVWDHEENSDRKLHPFLWFRDIVHRMRYAQTEGRHDEAHALAVEGEAYYAKHREEMGNYGAGIPAAMGYLGEIRKYLGVGVPMAITIQMEGQQATLEGVFLDTDEIDAIMRQIMDPEFKTRQSRYY